MASVNGPVALITHFALIVHSFLLMLSRTFAPHTTFLPVASSFFFSSSSTSTWLVMEAPWRAAVKAMARHIRASSCWPS
uniref:Putative secreted protein n=1 Tax=Anopheles darlingi TaxID=43151 RepID=A0A2M4D635_ANODA